ncbi:phage holin [Pseudoramibacter alactolyticus]|uniref:phage holin n=1 Tax=Pseudoramibacter alactolyticus TaxID=113287 RepID=UPI00248F28BC|nr:phage holin [Pseudoramibacter alactolyticus]
MKINLKLRLKNKVILVAIITNLVHIVYKLIDIIQLLLSHNFVPQDMVMDVVQLVIGVFVLLGIVVDPTTKGIKDSDQAMTYEKPADDQGVA